MTLNDWVQKHNETVHEHPDTKQKFVFEHGKSDLDKAHELYNLSDHAVSSVSGPVRWLVPADRSKLPTNTTEAAKLSRGRNYTRHNGVPVQLSRFADIRQTLWDHPDIRKMREGVKNGTVSRDAFRDWAENIIDKHDNPPVERPVAKSNSMLTPSIGL